MITPDILEHLTRLCGHDGGIEPPMLMLGAQESQIPGFKTARSWFAQYLDDVWYHELDLDGGDLKLDLNEDLAQLAGRYRTVFDIGTLEHVWNSANAYGNALRAVALGGRFLCMSPIGGWCDQTGRLNHGVHQTTREAIDIFLTQNGFEVDLAWDSTWRNRGRLLWLSAKKLRHIERLDQFVPVYQAPVPEKWRSS